MHINHQGITMRVDISLGLNKAGDKRFEFIISAHRVAERVYRAIVTMEDE